MTLETTQSLRILQIIGLSLSFFSASFGWSNCDPEKVKKIESLATRITQPQYFYRWGEGKYERQRMGKTPAFQMANVNFAKTFAGKGLYLAESPSETSQYAHPFDPEVVEVEIAKGTLILDLSSRQLIGSLKAHGLTIEDVFQCDPKALIRYNGAPHSFMGGAWAWVIKDPSATTIHPFTGRGIPIDALLKYQNQISDPKVRALFHERISSTLANTPWIPLQAPLAPEPPTHTSGIGLDSASCKPTLSSIQRTLSNLSNSIKACEKYFIHKSYHWFFDGSCGEFTLGIKEPTQFIQKVDQQLCRESSPTVFSQGVDGKCYEVVKNEPQIQVSSSNQEKCFNSELLCERSGVHRSKYSLNNVKMPGLYHLSKTFFDSADECQRAIDVAKKTGGLFCARGQDLIEIHSSKSLILSGSDRIYYEGEDSDPQSNSLEACQQQLLKGRIDLKIACIPNEAKNFSILDYSDPLNYNPIVDHSSFDSLARCQSFIKSIPDQSQTIVQKTRSQTSDQNIQEALQAPNWNHRELIHQLKHTYPYLNTLFEADAQVAEKYSVETHTGLVLDQFELQKKYYSLDQISNRRFHSRRLESLMKAALLLHDIGKSLGPTENQHYYTKHLFTHYLSKWGFTSDEISVVHEIVDHDELGQMIKFNGNPKTAYDSLRERARRAKMTEKDFFALQTLFYVSDASSYPNLQGLFKTSFFNKKLIPKSPAFDRLSRYF